MHGQYCQSCRFWDVDIIQAKYLPDTEPPDGECRRFPPSCSPSDDKSWYQPRTNAYDWCGEYWELRDYLECMEEESNG